MTQSQYILYNPQKVLYLNQGHCFVIILMNVNVSLTFVNHKAKSEHASITLLLHFFNHFNLMKLESTRV